MRRLHRHSERPHFRHAERSLKIRLSHDPDVGQVGFLDFARHDDDRARHDGSKDGEYPLMVGRESAHDEGGRFAYAES
jgi:hypothetical protein